jgi:hypothetical protein
MGTRSCWWVSACLVALLSEVCLSAQDAHQCVRLSVAANIELRLDLDRVVADLYLRSPTFKAQCDRLAEAQNLRVVVRLNPLLPSSCRALTKIWRHGRQIRADVQVPPGHELVELLAHEFEHLLEQVEGLNLRKLSLVRGSGVYEVDDELFESDRATKAGRLVAAEARRQPKAPAAD